MENFGTRLRKIRTDRKMTLEQLAEKCGSSENVIRGYEKSRRMPSSDMLLRLCEALRINPDYLYQDELSFNPYEGMGQLFERISRLPPSSLQLVFDMVKAIEKQELLK